MKTLLVLVLWLVATFATVIWITGCGSEFAAGAAVGGGVMGVKDALDTRVEELNERYKTAVGDFEQAVTDAEKLAAVAKIDALEKQLEEVKTAKTAIETGEVIVQTDWSTPAASGATAALITNILTALYYRRKDKK